MPYVQQERRKELDSEIEALVKKLKEMALGDVVYALYRITKDVYGNTKNYYTKAQGITALESTKLEYYRRILASYEDEKSKENGDI